MIKKIGVLIALLLISFPCFAGQILKNVTFLDVSSNATANFTGDFFLRRYSNIPPSDYPCFFTNSMALMPYYDVQLKGNAATENTAVDFFISSSSTANNGIGFSAIPWSRINLNCGNDSWAISCFNENKTGFANSLVFHNLSTLIGSVTPNIVFVNNVVITNNGLISTSSIFGISSGIVGGSGGISASNPQTRIEFKNGATPTAGAWIGACYIDATQTDLSLFSNKAIYVYSSFLAAGSALYYSSSGYLTTTAPSDYKLKKNVTLLPGGQLPRILMLQPKEYDWISNNKHGIGFIAQDLELVYPELVEMMPDGILGMHPDRLVPILIKAFQEAYIEQKTRLDSLEARIKALESAGTTTQLKTTIKKAVKK